MPAVLVTAVVFYAEKNSLFSSIAVVAAVLFPLLKARPNYTHQLIDRFLNFLLSSIFFFFTSFLLLASEKGFVSVRTSANGKWTSTVSELDRNL